MGAAGDQGWPPSVPPDLRALAERVLTAAQLEVFKLVARGYGYKRIAAIVGVSPDSARGRICRAEHRMFKELDRQAEKESPL